MSDKKTHFGFKEIFSSDKEKLVKDVFNSVASKYDLMNDIMSGGLHRVWKEEFVRLLHPREKDNVLDVGGGTGDIAFKIHKKTKGLAKVTVLDINENMLEEGKKRALNKGIVSNMEWMCENAQELPFEDETFSAYTISFCIRNVTEIQEALNEAYRVLKPGGRFFCLEFSKVEAPVLDKLYDTYSFNILPKIGKFVAKDEDSYRYLAESIRQFPPQEEFAHMITKAGFKNVGFKNQTGGICAIHWGMKE